MDKGERGNFLYELCLFKLFLDVEFSFFVVIFMCVVCMFCGGYKVVKVFYVSKICDIGLFFF